MNENNIPKVIHYCWFGGNPLPELALRCIESWKKFLPDYEIKEWNESNYNYRKLPYISQAYDAKKYAFVSDYARFDILYQYGGVYFDTDVEIIKDLSPIIKKGAFIGLEKGMRVLLNAGLGIASPAASEIYKEILESYQAETFVNSNGSLNLKTVCERVSEIFEKHGFIEKDCLQNIADTTIYPTDFFCPKDNRSGELIVTPNTYTIHHYDGSWTIPLRKKYVKIKTVLARILGIRVATVILIPVQIVCIIKEVGFKSFLKKI